ncbi:hypothetical protein [Methylophilus methylotrophus]|uniref:hypothetical protein n=1 Tax=Methylophilus methylotrophus TaxID=17 RepID=UPI0003655C9C|nr:hypothetical protein [Methylophilus methylotrophus]
MQAITKHPIYGDLFRDVLRSNKGINLASNNNHILKALVNSETLDKFLKFQKKLKDLKLKLIHFSIGFNSETDKYQLVYEIESKIHSNSPARVDRFLDINLPFVFIPSLVNDIVNSALNDIPFPLLVEVSEGN